jgi:hypothetical protein
MSDENKNIIAVIVPLFPRLPAIRQSLVSLRDQTRQPDLVVLLDDGSNPDAESLHEVIPELEVEVVQVEPGTVSAAVNQVVEYLESFDYFAFLQAGDYYAPMRLAKCLDAMGDEKTKRPPAVVVTAMNAVDGRGNPLTGEDPRTQFLERLWAPGQSGGIPEWLGAGNFVGPASNIFARRNFIAANPLSEAATSFSYSLAILAGVQGLLAVIDEPLLRHHPGPEEREPTSKNMSELLQLQLHVLHQLKDKLVFSSETRRNLATFHRAAWNNLSGLREDLFEQLILRLASALPPEDVTPVIAEIQRSLDAQVTPPHLHELKAGADPLDLASYAANLRRTRDQLKELREENERLARIATAAQESGWVRFGAWIGERSSRLIMEMDEPETSALQTPDGKVESRGEANPEQIGNEEPTGRTADTEERPASQDNGGQQQDDTDQGESGTAQAEKERRP